MMTPEEKDAALLQRNHAKELCESSAWAWMRDSMLAEVERLKEECCAIGVPAERREAISHRVATLREWAKKPDEQRSALTSLLQQQRK
jgi:hypothetical protein